MSRRNIIVLLVIVIAIHLSLAWSLRLPGMAWGEDDAEYTILARELVHGQYREAWNVDAPVHARLPPGFPMVLAAWNLVGPDTYAGHQVAVMLCSALSLIVLFAMVRARMGVGPAFFVTGLSAVGMSYVLDAGTVMSEAPFRLFVLLALWFASKERARSRDLLLAGACAVIASLIRSAGVALLVALAVHWALERRWRAVVGLTLGALPVAAWLLWTALAPDPGQRGLYVHVITAALTHPEQVPDARPILQRVTQNAWTYVRAQFPAAMSFFALKHNALDNALWAALLLATVPLGVVRLWRSWRVLVLTFVLYGGVLVVWPFGLLRFASPATPLVLILIAGGTLGLTARRSRGAAVVALGVIAFLFAAGAVQALVPTIRQAAACDRADPVDSRPCFLDGEQGLLLLSRYVRDSTPPDAIFWVPKEGAFFLHSDRLTVRDNSVNRVPADSVGVVLRRARVEYAAVTPIGIAARRRNRLIAQACRDFDLVAAFEGNAVLLRVRPGGPLDHDGEACARTSQWRDDPFLR